MVSPLRCGEEGEHITKRTHNPSRRPLGLQVSARHKRLFTGRIVLAARRFFDLDADVIEVGARRLSKTESCWLSTRLLETRFRCDFRPLKDFRPAAP
jgi:hypothetical protein